MEPRQQQNLYKQALLGHLVNLRHLISDLTKKPNRSSFLNDETLIGTYNAFNQALITNRHIWEFEHEPFPFSKIEIEDTLTDNKLANYFDEPTSEILESELNLLFSTILNSQSKIGPLLLENLFSIKKSPVLIGYFAKSLLMKGIKTADLQQGLKLLESIKSINKQVGYKNLIIRHQEVIAKQDNIDQFFAHNDLDFRDLSYIDSRINYIASYLYLSYQHMGERHLSRHLSQSISGDLFNELVLGIKSEKVTPETLTRFLKSLHQLIPSDTDFMVTVLDDIILITRNHKMSIDHLSLPEKEKNERASISLSNQLTKLENSVDYIFDLLARDPDYPHPDRDHRASMVWHIISNALALFNYNKSNKYPLDDFMEYIRQVMKRYRYMVGFYDPHPETNLSIADMLRDGLPQDVFSQLELNIFNDTKHLTSQAEFIRHLNELLLETMSITDKSTDLGVQALHILRDGILNNLDLWENVSLNPSDPVSDENEFIEKCHQILIEMNDNLGLSYFPSSTQAPTKYQYDFMDFLLSLKVSESAAKVIAVCFIHHAPKLATPLLSQSDIHERTEAELSDHFQKIKDAGGESAGLLTLAGEDSSNYADVINRALIKQLPYLTPQGNTLIPLISYFLTSNTSHSGLKQFFDVLVDQAPESFNQELHGYFMKNVRGFRPGQTIDFSGHLSRFVREIVYRHAILEDSLNSAGIKPGSIEDINVGRLGNSDNVVLYTDDTTMALALSCSSNIKDLTKFDTEQSLKTATLSLIESLREIGLDVDSFSEVNKQPVTYKQMILEVINNDDIKSQIEHMDFQADRGQFWSTIQKDATPHEADADESSLLSFQI